MYKVLKNLFSLGYKVKLASSSSYRGTSILENKFFYKSIIDEIKTDEEKRKIFKDIKNNDAIKIICKTGGLRTVLLSPEK